MVPPLHRLLCRLRTLLVAVLLLATCSGSDSDARADEGKCLRLQEGGRLELDCGALATGPIRFPMAWMKDTRRFLPPSGGNVRLEMTRLVIETARREDAGVYMCSNMMAAGYGQPIAGRVLHVYTPIDLRPLSPRAVVRQGSTLRLRCDASAVPRPRISWWKNGEPLEGGGRVRLLHGPPPESLPLAQLELSDMGDDDEAVYSCRASHRECGQHAQTSTTVFVRMNAVQTNEEIPGKGILLDPRSKSLVLQCNSTENPGLDIIWFKDGKKLSADEPRYSQNSDTNTLVINDPTYADTGNYTCAVVDGGDNATIVVQTNVTIEVSEISKNQVEGDPLTLSCKAFGVPVPEVTWFKNDEPLNISDPRISLEPLDNVTNAKLVIQNLNFDDRAEYTCFATNGISNATMMVLVRVKDKLAALWPFLGICVEVAVLCAIIFIYEKKRVKPDFEESDTDQNPENKNLSDQKEGQDIRQRK
ncbi:neuroplastin isoform X2 [Ixodes scapularis]|uniref:neuroplastin isoform X2 n=1 Tax=Ixodes scapularis TaxID=6945 RepID=UPI001C3941B5|nr:neuroplastin isoform X2 [Ixodes scapularis]